MIKEYSHNKLNNWYNDLNTAYVNFVSEFTKKPSIVGYNEENYKKICLITNQEKYRITDDLGNNPENYDYVKIGKIKVEDEKELEILTSDDLPKDRFVLMDKIPDGDDGEPYYTLEMQEIKKII